MQKKEARVEVRMTDREKKTLKRKAAKYEMTVSEYARTLLIHSDDVSIKVIDTEPLKKAALRRESVRPGGSETSFGERGLDIF